MNRSFRALKILFASVIGFGVVSATLFVGINNSSKDFSQAEAASHPANFASYSYSGAYYNGISDSLTEGPNGSLRTSLTTLIHPTTVPTYGNSGDTHLSTVLQYADEDPTNSANMIYLYTRDSVKKNAASSWNREHVWPQSLSNSCWGTGRAGTDLLHLRPTYNTTNSTRGNLKYGQFSGGETKVYNGITYGYTSGSYFMPLDSVKGDVARIIMYVWVAYYNEYGSKLPAITNVFQSFDVLMSWHCSDQPDVMEGNRNNYSETSMQGNRNPFVDHPEYAWKIFGSNCSSSVLANAKATYPANGSSSGTTTSVSISTSSASINVGDSITLSATSSDSSTITWSKSNSNVNLSATTGGSITVTGVSAGTSTIYATNTSGAKASCAITISSASSGGGEQGSASIDFSENGNCTSTSGDFTTFNFSTSKNSAGNDPAYNSSSYELRLYYAGSGNGNGLTITPASGYSITKVVITASGSSYTPTIKYQVNGGSETQGTWNSTTMTIDGINASTSFYFKNANTTNTQLRIKKIDLSLNGGSSSTGTLSSISVSGMTTSFYKDDTFVFDGTCTATYTSGSPKTVTPTTVSSPNMSTTGSKTVTVSYTEGSVTKSTSYQITVKAPATVSSLSKTGTLTKTTYYDGDAFDPSGLTITAHYSDNTTKNVTTDVAWTPSPLTAGTTIVTGTYGGQTISINDITVHTLTLTSISLSGQTTVYTVGDSFSFDGSIQAVYSNGNKKLVDPTHVDDSAVNMLAEGTYTVRVYYTENSTTKSASYSISVVETPFVNSIQHCYELNDGATATNVYGLYIGSATAGGKQHALIMNGEYGIELFGTTPDASWVENQTYLKVTTSTLDIYNNLYELTNCTVVKVTDATTIRQNVAPVSTYNVTGLESSTNSSLASRLSLISGVVTSFKADWTNNKDNTIYLSIGNYTVQLFVKAANATSDVGTALTNSYNNGAEITIKGYTNIYSTYFQVVFKNVVEIDTTYTAEDFAEDLLELTNSICSTSTNKETDLSGVWMTLTIEKWSVLSQDQKNILINSGANENGTTIEQAMARYDLICRKYSSCDNFIGRNSANLSASMNPILANNNSLLIVLTMVSIITISGIAVLCCFKRKKKEQ